MRFWFLLIGLVPALLLGQQPDAWEKIVVPGLKYRMERDLVTPRLVHILELDRDAANLSLRPALANEQVWDRSELRGRATLSRVMEQTGAIAGVNADFFAWNGDPLGLMMLDGELLSRPDANRAAFLWGPEGADVRDFETNIVFGWEGGTPLRVFGINEEAGANMAVLNTPRAGLALSRNPALHALIDLDSTIGPNGVYRGTFRYFVADETEVEVEPGQVVLTATGTPAQQLLRMERGSTVSIQTNTEGLDAERFPYAIGGGPMLINDGEINVPWRQGNFQSDFAERRHPRTAIGIKADGDLLLVAVDGRQSMSDGATLSEIARIMRRLGAVEALNLDGGGSTSLNVGGVNLNRLRESERPISNALLIFGPSIVDQNRFVIQGAPRMSTEEARDYRLVDGRGRLIPNHQIFWSATGAAWIDQGGRLRPIEAGIAIVRALYQGQVAEVQVVVEAPEPVEDPPVDRP
ncbi:MAG: phosphodiester glycosidase family protein [Fimbriimonadaceae bacterium]